MTKNDLLLFHIFSGVAAVFKRSMSAPGAEEDAGKIFLRSCFCFVSQL